MKLRLFPMRDSAGEVREIRLRRARSQCHDVALNFARVTLSYGALLVSQGPPSAKLLNQSQQIP